MVSGWKRNTVKKDTCATFRGLSNLKIFFNFDKDTPRIETVVLNKVCCLNLCGIFFLKSLLIQLCIVAPHDFAMSLYLQGRTSLQIFLLMEKALLESCCSQARSQSMRARFQGQITDQMIILSQLCIVIVQFFTACNPFNK